MVLMKDVPASVDTKFLVLSKLAELYARTDQDKHAKKMVAEGRRLAVTEDSVPWLERFQLLAVYISCTFGRAAEGAGAPPPPPPAALSRPPQLRSAACLLQVCSPSCTTRRPLAAGCRCS